MEAAQGLRTPWLATETRDGQTRTFQENYRKDTPRSEIMEPRKHTPKIAANQNKYTQSGHFWCFGGIFLVYYFRGILGIFSGGPEFRAGGGGIFRYFSWKAGSGHLQSLGILNSRVAIMGWGVGYKGKRAESQDGEKTWKIAPSPGENTAKYRSRANFPFLYFLGGYFPPFREGGAIFHIFSRFPILEFLPFSLVH